MPTGTYKNSAITQFCEHHAAVGWASVEAHRCRLEPEDQMRVAATGRRGIIGPAVRSGCDPRGILMAFCSSSDASLDRVRGAVCDRPHLRRGPRVLVLLGWIKAPSGPAPLGG